MDVRELIKTLAGVPHDLPVYSSGIPELGSGEIKEVSVETDFNGNEYMLLVCE